MSPFEKACPKCKEFINIDAKTCGCGWTAEKKRGEKEIPWNHVCTWQYGALKCKNPVGLFLQGETSGLCVFHRSSPKGHIAAQIAEESLIHDKDSYNLAAARQVYGSGENPTVSKMREQIESHPNARKGGSFSDLGKWVEICKARGSQ